MTAFKAVPMARQLNTVNYQLYLLQENLTKNEFWRPFMYRVIRNNKCYTVTVCSQYFIIYITGFETHMQKMI